MGYQISYSKKLEKQIKKLDKPTVMVIKNWITKKLVDTDNPREHGRELKGNLQGIWRYRIGDYRLFAKIEDNKLLIFIFELGHRREVYKRINQ